MTLSGCSVTRVVAEPDLVPPSEAAVKSELPPVFMGKTVADLVDYNLDLLSQYRKLSIRHDALVDWVYNKNKND